MIGKEVIIRGFVSNISVPMYFAGTIVDTHGEDKYLVEIISGVSYDYFFRPLLKIGVVEIFKKKDFFDEENYTILDLYNDKYSNKNKDFLKMRQELRDKQNIDRKLRLSRKRTI